jgi:hypothetical protein
MLEIILICKFHSNGFFPERGDAENATTEPSEELQVVHFLL